MADFAKESCNLASKLGRIRRISWILGIGNLAVLSLGWYLSSTPLSRCSGGERLPFASVAFGGGFKLAAMVGAAIAQQATAATIVGHQIEGYVAVDSVIRHKRRKRYRRWLCWARFGMAITVLQSLAALYLSYIVISDFSYGGELTKCFLGDDGAATYWKKLFIASFVVLAWLVFIIQCCAGSDVLRWRSFYATYDAAWKTHYEEVFDHGIREALCCLGRVKYLSALEEDEVYSVARLLGDIVVYRGSGTRHLELLAGLALLQGHKEVQNLFNELDEAPPALIEEATFFHPYAEAAYTKRFDIQGLELFTFTISTVLAKFLTVWYSYLVCSLGSQKKREAAYFVVVLHEQRSLVIAVRGTETPEDLITDGNHHLSSSLRQRVLSTFPHYGHSGIVESARELFVQLDDQSSCKDDLLSETPGFLSSLLGSGCECQGYKVYIVGHSLGGAVATMLGLRLAQRYPNLHVYAYGTPPCVDEVVAEACSDFVTTIVCNDEFSARLSVNAVLRLRSAAITALSDDTSNSALVHKLALRILRLNERQMIGKNHNARAPFQRTTAVVDCDYTCGSNCNHGQDVGSSTFDKDDFTKHSEQLPTIVSGDTLSFGDETSRMVEESRLSTEVLLGDSPELYLPGLIIHLVQEHGNPSSSWWIQENKAGYRALLARRESFRDIVINLYMFLDHLPWRCQHALQKVLQRRRSQGQRSSDGEEIA
ncbi:sn1-specific diacylglycerol lipase [Apostasia shenzhenica]|uniref:Sn1-specific diacylglycerol lipase n=1 Tax=Apostasia shenzhenica TaxID=1088818 RepID=A0A2I0AKE2_9ASPA|nr:sn1-specific diacylglycerol lipase [Apostasia shenzhenica]